MSKSKYVPSANNDHRKRNQLSDIILGGQDGLVNVLGVILGVAAATTDTRIVLAAGFAATFAESVSMAAVAYTSKVAERDYYKSMVEVEKREMKEMPESEVEEIRQIYIKKGFRGDLLERIVSVITSDEQVWLETMMRDELVLTPVHDKRPLGAALIVGLSALAGSLIPLAPFIVLSIGVGMYVSILISALVLFAVGVIKAKMTIGHWGKSGLQMAVIGVVSALVGYVVGLLFQV